MSTIKNKLMSVLALGCFVFGVSSSLTFAGPVEGLNSANGIVFEKQVCAEGEEWNEEKKACEKKGEQ